MGLRWPSGYPLRMPEDLAPLLEHYGLAPTAPAQPVGVGTLNWNYRIETDQGPRFVRKHRVDLPRERIEQEHELVRWAVERGIPAPLAQQALDGNTVLEHEGALWAVFPWVEGVPPVRGQMDPHQAFEAGAMHGRIHRVLIDYPQSVEVTPPPAFDVARSSAHLARILSAAQEQRAEDWIIEGLTFQLALLREHGTNASEAGLARSPSHGDYHDQQLLFGPNGNVAAVTDWELFGMRPRAWELVRSAAFSQILETPLLEDYVSGYCEHMALPADECRLAIELWWQGRIHSAWVFQAHFLEGNKRVAEFFPESLRALHALADADARRELTERFLRAATG